MLAGAALGGNEGAGAHDDTGADVDVLGEAGADVDGVCVGAADVGADEDGAGEVDGDRLGVADVLGDWDVRAHGNADASDQDVPWDDDDDALGGEDAPREADEADAEADRPGPTSAWRGCRR